jgi:hypothetical protein
VGICLEEAKRHGLKVRIFDEQWWPSQGGGGKVPACFAAKQLEASAVLVEGPRVFEAQENDECLIAVVAIRFGNTGITELVSGRRGTHPHEPNHLPRWIAIRI